jgi:carbon-monoxide dehydrogenase large subunit
MPGVLGIYTGPDLTAAGMKPMPLGMAIPTRDGSPMHRPVRPVLTSDRVRYVGDPVAIVVAETAVQAKDAAEVVFLDIEPLPAVSRASEAATSGAPQLHDEVPGNVAAEFHYGDAEKVAAAFATVAHVTRLQIPSNRIVVCPMEPRSAIADYDPANERWTLRVGCQGVFGLRNGLAAVLGVERDQVRVLTGNVGGSFGMKSAVYPEYLALFHAARALGRPVKWTDERSESFVSDSHGRDHEMTAELVLDADGNFLAVRVTGYGNLGAYCRPGRADPANRQRRQERNRCLQNIIARSLDQDRRHQHPTGWCLSGSRPSGGQLLHGAAGRHGSGRDGDRPCRIAPPQPHCRRGDAV